MAGGIIQNQKVFFIHNFDREDNDEVLASFCVAYQYVKNGVMLAVAFCNEEKYDKKIGRKIATDRLENGQSMLLTHEVISKYISSPIFAIYSLMDEGYSEEEAIYIVENLPVFDFIQDGTIGVLNIVEAKELTKTFLNRVITYIITDLSFSQTLKSKYLSDSKDKSLLNVIVDSF